MIGRLFGRGALVTAVLVAALAGPVVAQRSALERVEELARLGRPDEARSVLLEWWNSGRDDASRRDLQRGLWLRGRLTVDPVQAELDFQRLVVLYPRGPFTAAAILRLAQGAHAMGDADGARAFVATLTRDYAGTPERDDAERWLRTAGPAPPPPGARPAESSDDPPRNPAIGPDPPATRTPPSEAAPRDPPPAVVAGAGNYYVQLGAFAEESRALSLYEEVTAAGIDVRVVRVAGSRFLHVRYGRFVNRADAVDELERLGEAGISAALVRDERAEELVRD